MDDLDWQFRLANALASKDAEHLAETERLLAVITAARSALDRLASADDPGETKRAGETKEPGETKEANGASTNRTARLIAETMDAALRDIGVETIGKRGEDADPLIHRIVGTEPSSGTPADQVVDVLRHGYRYRGLIEPADVIISVPPPNHADKSHADKNHAKRQDEHDGDKEEPQ